MRQPPHDVLLATSFSPDGHHLVCAGSSGRVHVWALDRVLRSPSDGVERDAAGGSGRASFGAHSNAVYSMEFVRVAEASFLVTGGDTHIKGWDWAKLLDALARGDAPTPAFRLEHPRATGVRGSVGALAEANDLAFDPKSATLFTAAGDGNAYAWDLRTSKLARTFTGHDGYLHCVASRARNGQIVTGSEDCTAKLWDLRAAEASATLRPPGEACGWCSCAQVDATEDWLVCGWGAGVLTTWSLSAQTCTAAMPTAAPPQQVRFGSHSQSSVYSVGAESLMYEWTLAGTLVRRVACAPTSLFGIDSTSAVREAGLVAACGNAACVQLFDAEIGMVLCELDTCS